MTTGSNSLNNLKIIPIMDGDNVGNFGFSEVDVKDLINRIFNFNKIENEKNLSEE